MHIKSFMVVLALTASAVVGQVRKDRHVIVISLDGFPAYALADQSLPFPNIRKLMASGATARVMIPVNPTVTWPNHTSMVTGVRPARHGVLYNGLPVRGADGFSVHVEASVDKGTLVQAPTVYDAAFRAGLSTGEIDWVAIQSPGTITYSFAEIPSADSGCVKEMVGAGLVSDADVRAFTKKSIVFRDEIWTRAAEHMIEKHQPNLLLYHLLTTDSNQHSYGARSLGAYTSLALADSRVGRLVAAVERAGIADRTTFIVVSDHGFRSYSKTLRTMDFVPDAIAKDVFIVPEGGTAMVYVRPSRRAELVPQLRSAFSAKASIAAVYGPEDFGRFGYPDPAKNDRMADLVLAAAEPYSFAGKTADQAGGAHGYLSSDPDMSAILVMAGAGVRKGASVDQTANIDVAPTIGELLGLKLEGVEGVALTSLLEAQQ
jgi:predicted AlkP superfamily pyrophosphatase or phosphodiesterase